MRGRKDKWCGRVVIRRSGVIVFLRTWSSVLANRRDSVRKLRITEFFKLYIGGYIDNRGLDNIRRAGAGDVLDAGLSEGCMSICVHRSIFQIKSASLPVHRQNSEPILAPVSRYILKFRCCWVYRRGVVM